jgi:hypothetical protein
MAARRSKRVPNSEKDIQIMVKFAFLVTAVSCWGAVSAFGVTIIFSCHCIGRKIPYLNQNWVVEALGIMEFGGSLIPYS